MNPAKIGLSTVAKTFYGPTLEPIMTNG